MKVPIAWLSSLILICLLIDTTSAQLLPWTQSNQDGFGDPANTTAHTPTEFKGILYVAACNDGGVQIWRTPDGVTWSRVAETVNFQFMQSGQLFTYGDGLYFCGDSWTDATHTTVAGTIIFKTTDGVNWQLVNEEVRDSNLCGNLYSAEYNSYLYAMTAQGDNGLVLWRTSDGETWTTVGTAGLDGDVNRKHCYGMVVFGAYLYFLVTNYAGAGYVEVIRYDGSTFTVVYTGAAGTVADFIEEADSYLYLVIVAAAGHEIYRSSTGDPGSWTLVYTYTGPGWPVDFEDHKNAVYFSTYEATNGFELFRSPTGAAGAWSQVGAAGFGRANDAAGRLYSLRGYLWILTGTTDGVGPRIYRSTDGINWVQVNEDGFGDDNNIAMGYMAEFKGYIYVTTSNGETGTEVWRYSILKPVGGVLMPTNKLEILTPYIALVGLVAAVSAVVVVRKRR